MGESLPNHHEDHIAGKGDNSLQHYNLVLKFIPIPQALKIPAAKAAVDKEWEKLEKIPAWDLTKVRSKSEVIDEARTKGAKVHFASLMDIGHLKNAELEAKHQIYKGRVVLRGDRRSHCRKRYEYHWVKCTNLFRIPLAMKIPDAKAPVEKEWEKLEKILAWQLTKVRNKKEVIDEARNKDRKVHFVIDGSMLSSEEFGARTSISKVQRQSCTPRRYCKIWLWILSSIHGTRIIISISNDCSKNHGYHIQNARMRRTSSWCSIC